MPRVAVDVMLKPEIADPQGQAINRALPRLGYDGVLAIRQGKRFELDLSDDLDAASALDLAARIADTLLANPVIEEYSVRLADSQPAD